MEQRPLRLGDIVDDYCPRERRITNHAVVAIVEDAIRQTRCTTCDTEHVYKHAREPVKRRKDARSADDAARGQLVAPRAVTEPSGADPAEARSFDSAEDRPAFSGGDGQPGTVAPEPGDDVPAPAAVDDHWPAHRQLIRATLPRIEGEPPAPRPIPEFTMHQRPQPRGGFRFGQGHNGNVRSGNLAHGRNPQGRGGGHGDGRAGNRQGNAAGPPPGRSGRRRGHGKRSR
jgi:hypothetical protein